VPSLAQEKKGGGGGNGEQKRRRRVPRRKAAGALSGGAPGDFGKERKDLLHSVTEGSPRQRVPGWRFLGGSLFVWEREKTPNAGRRKGMPLTSLLNETTPFPNLRPRGLPSQQSNRKRGRIKEPEGTHRLRQKKEGRTLEMHLKLGRASRRKKKDSSCERRKMDDEWKKSLHQQGGGVSFRRRFADGDPLLGKGNWKAPKKSKKVQIFPRKVRESRGEKNMRSGKTTYSG